MEMVMLWNIVIEYIELYIIYNIEYRIYSSNIDV
jgi:hypothetical protein